MQSFTFTEISHCQQNVKQLYINTRFNIQRDIWQLLHPKHFVNLLLIHHTACNREKDIVDVATIMSHGLTLSKSNLQLDDSTTNDANTSGLLECFATNIESEQALGSIKTNKISDIFRPFKSNNGSTTTPNFILIEGAPGMGKTTLCKEIAYQWAQGCLLKDTELLLLIYLRHPAILNIHHLQDLVHYFYNFDKGESKMSKRCAKILNNRDLTIVCDGYDEFDSSKDSLIANILDRKVLPQCRIVVTSRLTASDRLHRIADVRVEVLGFSDESKIQYIKQELKEHPYEVNKLQSYLNTHPSIQSICYMPMMMTILVYVFKEKGYLPTNSTELYEKYVALTISHQSKSDDLCVSIQTLPTECKSFLFHLSKFAFLTLQSKQKVFSKEDINSVCPNLTLTSSDLDSLGLINSVQYFCTDKGNTCVFNFLHLSIHEYLAAYYISSIDQCSQFNELENTFLNEMYQETWNMFIAMNKNKKTWLDFQTYSVYSKDTHYDILFKWIADHKSLSFSECFVQLYNIINANSMSSDVVQIIFSKNDISVANAHQEQIYLSLWDAKTVHQMKLKLFIIDEATKILNSKLFILLKNLHYSGFSVIFYKYHSLLLNKVTQKETIDFFKHNNSITRMILKDCHVTKSSIDALQLSCIQHLQILHVVSCSFEHSALIKLMNYLSSISTLLSITFQDTHFSTEQVHATSSAVLSSSTLIVLNLSNNNLQIDIVKIAKALEHTRSLKVLNISNNNIPQSAATAISSIITLNTSLTEFYIAGNNLKSSMIVILECLSRISSLKILDLSNNHIPVKAGKALASVVIHNKKLEELHLSNNNLGEGMLVITKALQQITSLRAISIGNTNISKKASDEIPLVVKSNKYLEKFGLYNNDLKWSAISILQSLSTISTLKFLNINNTQITHEAGEVLASVVTHNTELEKLHLNNNNLGEEMLVVTKALQQITSLTSINLGNTNISKEASDEIPLVVKSNKHLEKFWLYNNDLKCSAIAILQSLSTISTLKLLNINNTQTTDEADEALASVVTHNTGLEELHLNNNNLGEGMLAVTKALQKITSLKSLDLGNTNISKEASDEIPLVVKSNKYLEKLWLHNNNLKCSAITILQSLSTISTLKFLNINNTQTKDEAGEALASVIVHNKALKELHLADNNLGEGILNVTNALQQITSLRSINLGNNNIPKEASDELALDIQSNKHLEELQLYNINLKCSAIAILQSLSTISTLKLLNIHNTQITFEAGEALASVVTGNTGLEELHLNNNNLGEGMLVVTKALQEITSLRSINLGNTNISKEAANEIPLVVKSNKHLEKLWLYNNNLRCSAIAILRSLSTISTLTLLAINNAQITDEATEALASVVTHNTGLEVLHLSNNNLGEGMLVVTKALQQITSLKLIDLGNTNISKEASDEIPLVVKSNKYLEKLWLYNNDLKCSAIAILQSLSTISTLTLLAINNAQITNEASEALASAVTHNTGLEVVLLNNNNLGEGMLVVTKVLEQNTSLRAVGFGNTNISKEASDEIPLIVKSNKYLEKLLLNNNDLKCSVIAILQSLSTISTLKLLNINNTQITDEAGEALASVVTHNTGLEELHLSNNNLGEGMLVVTKALQKITSLRSIDLGNTNISKEASDEIPFVVKSNKYLEKLWLHNNNLKCSAITILQSLSTISTLKLLNIHNTQITDEAGEALASVIVHNKALKELHLADNNLGEGILNVTNALQQITSLRSINLGNNNISREASGELALAIQLNKHLEELQLYNINLKCSAIAILQSLSTISTLKLLNIYNTQITFEAGEALASVVTHNTGLEELHLNNNNLGEGMLVVTKALQEITSLRSINLGNTNISKEASDEIALVVKSNKYLEKLWLYNNNLKCSAIAILQSLSTISTLKLLNINNTQITDEAGEALASVVTRNIRLEELHLSNNNFGEGMLVVTKALQEITSLRSIDLGNTNISKEASSEIPLVVKSNKYLERLWLHNNNLKCSAITILQSLSTISTLKLLNISNAQTKDEAGEALASVIIHNKALEELHLADNNLGEGILIVINTLQQITSLRSINLGNNNISREASGELALVIQSNMHLEKLWLENNNLRCSAIAILQSLSTISTLKLLNIHNTQITNEAAEPLASVVTGNTGLEELHLSDNNLGEGMLVVTKALQQITLLRSLYLGNTNISKEAANEIPLVVKSNQHLEKLWLNNNNLNCSGIAILQSLSTISSLTLLVINNTQITNEATEALASVVTHNTGLEVLLLNNNNLGEGMLVVMKALQQITSLRTVGFGNTNISKEASDKIPLVVKSNKHLEKLLLNNNNFKSSVIAILKSLSTISTLKLLVINNTQITHEASEALASVVTGNTGLEELHLNNNNLGERMLVVTKALQEITSLRSLDLGNTYISKEASDEIPLVVKSNKYLERLWLHNNNLKCSAIAIFQSLSTISTLKFLNINNTQTKEEAGEALASVIIHNKALEELHLADNNLGEGILIVINTLQQITSLRSINLGNNNISREASGELALVIQSNMHLEKLWLENNNLRCSAIAILQSLSTISALKLLNIHNTQITNEAAEPLASVVTGNTGLEELHLNNNNLGEGMLVVTKALQQITSLRSIDLSNTNISKEASDEIPFVVKSNKHLEKLWLYNNNLKCSGIAILRSLSTISTLTLLAINNAQIMDEATEALASVVTHNTRLEVLHLSNNNLGEGMLVVTKALQQITSLKSIDLGNTNISKEASDEIPFVVKSNKYLEKLWLYNNNLKCSAIAILQSLSTISTLTLLAINNAQITNEASEALASAVTHNTGLEVVLLNNNNLGEGMLVVTKVLEQNTSLRAVGFGNTNISKEASDEIPLIVKSNKHLEKLWLNNNNLKCSVIAILQSLSTISTLKLLNINNTQITNEASEALASVVTGNTGLEELYLSNNNLGEGMLVVTKALQKITSLRSIDLGNTNISKEAANDIPLVVKSNHHLEKLWLNNNNLNCSGIAIFQSLSTISSLTLLAINNTQITHEASEALASVVTHNTGLEVLLLNNNNLGEGMLVVMKALQQITSLRAVGFGNTNISKEASDKIPLVVKSNKHLEKLWLNNNNLNCSGIAILQSLSTISSLTLLAINNTQITHEASEALASVVTHNTGLEVLLLNNNNLGEGMLVVTKALQKITSLRSIGFGNTNISKEASDEIPLVIKSNKHLKKMWLNYNNLNCTGIAILQSLSTISSLTLLAINNTQITHEASEALASVVTHNTGIEVLLLNNNNLGEGMLVVMKALQQITSLRAVGFGNTNISKEASDEIPLVVKSNKHLEKLWLNNNNLNCSGIAILQSLSTISSLTLLAINNTQITHEASEALASVVTHNTGIEVLLLNNNNLGEGMLVVMKALQQITSLRAVGFGNTNISKEASDEIPLVIKSNKHLD